MTAFEWYSFFLCLIVFVLLTILFGCMLAMIIKQTVRLIRCGQEDEAIKKEYLAGKRKKQPHGCLESIVTLVLAILMLIFFAFSLFVNFTEKTYFDSFPTLHVVNSGSMAKKHEKNTYLWENKLNNHIQTFDMILTYRIPAEEDINVFDIVVYEVDGIYVVHRIVEIEEPCANHPNERYFLLQGDAVERPDRFPVRYDQMRGIYRGERVPFIGSFVTFMQSPAGWLCVLLIIGSIIGVPILEKAIEKEKRLRLAAMGLTEEQAATAESVHRAETVTVAEDVVFLGEVAPPTPPPIPESPSLIVEEENIPDSPFARFGKGTARSFDEALAAAGEKMQDRYARIIAHLARFRGVRVISAWGARTYKCGNTPVVRLTVRGRTLNAYLALPPAELSETKYVFEDVTEIKSYANYPTRVRVSSERQTRWTIELLNMLAERQGITLLAPSAEMPDPMEVESSSAPRSPFAHLRGISRSFDERLAHATKETKERYKRIAEALLSIPNIRVIQAHRQKTYKCGNTPIARLAIKGKTLNVYLPLDPAVLTETKYIYEDISARRSHANYPVRVRVSSERQTRWVLELLARVLKENGIGEEGKA